jgi:cell wall-associated NlpC family hydrolase
MSISQTVKEGNGVFTPVKDSEKFKTYRTGDVLVRHGAEKSNNESASEHIAIVTKAGQIVEAADSTKGVRVTSLDSNRFNHHVRFSSYFWSVKSGIK